MRVIFHLDIFVLIVDENKDLKSSWNHENSFWSLLADQQNPFKTETSLMKIRASIEIAYSRIFPDI